MDRREDLRSRAYSMGSFLLVRAPRVAYNYVSVGYLSVLLSAPDLVPALFFPAEVEIPLGRPLGGAKEDIEELAVKSHWEGFSFTGKLYARKFAKGVVLVNPSASQTVEVAVPESFQHQLSFRGAAYMNTRGEIVDFPKHPRRLCTQPLRQTTLPPTSALIFLKELIATDTVCPDPW